MTAQKSTSVLAVTTLLSVLTGFHFRQRFMGFRGRLGAVARWPGRLW